MSNSNLKKFVSDLSAEWGPLTSELTFSSKKLLEKLSRNCTTEHWYQELLKSGDSDKEIYRSAEHGFILMGHVENKGDFSPPHDHGNGWVLYSTVQGRVNMGIYHKLLDSDGKMRLVQKDACALSAGDCSIYLPGDIHDTHTVEQNTVMLRLTSCDFREEVEQGRLVRFSHNVEKW